MIFILLSTQILDKSHPTSKLVSLPNTIKLDYPKIPSSKKFTFHTVAGKESTPDKVSMLCKCKDKRTWCITRHCKCVQAEVKCSVACHSGKTHMAALFVLTFLPPPHGAEGTKGSR